MSSYNFSTFGSTDSSQPVIDGSWWSTRKKGIFVNVSTFFIVIATVLGTGILGIPVKLARTGFMPFFVNYTICFLMQCACLFYVVELLQRAKVAFQNSEYISEDEDSLTYSLRDRLKTSTDIPESPSTNERPSTPNENTTTTTVEEVDLHSLGKVFLGPKLVKVFDVSVVLHFTSILISYALAGSEAYGSVFGVNYEYLILPFVFILTCIVVFASNIIEAIISVLTFTKGSVLVFVVFITMIVGSEANQESVSNWLYIGKPLLISTVALGGAVTLVPVVFGKVSFNQSSMRNFMMAIILGEFVVWILNVFWCFYILEIVPQTGDVSLYTSEKNGEIATIPLIHIIKEFYPQYSWIASLINIFIMVSITVSFITMSTGMKHVLEGFIRSSNNLTPSGDCTASIRQQIRTMNPKAKKAILYTTTFSLIYILAQGNPKSLILVMEYFTSLALNLASGVLVAWMLGNSRTERFHHCDVPYVIPNWLFKFRYVVMFYFVFAIVYDLASGLASIIAFNK